MKPILSKTDESVSVVIPTYNSEKSLLFCLKSINAQSCPCKEILVVDNYSRDETRRVAETFNAKIFLRRGTQAAARNLGLFNSTAKYVLFVDSDQLLEADVVEACMKTCNSRQVEAVKIPEVFIGENFWGRCSAFWKNKMVTAWGEEGGIPRFYRRDVLLRFSAFNDELRFWDDQELHQRLKDAGVKEAWCKSRVFHCESGSLRDVTVKYLSYGQSIVTFEETGKNAPRILTAKLTVSTMLEVLRNPGRSLRLFLGFAFLFAVKSMSAALGFLANQSFLSSPQRME